MTDYTIYYKKQLSVKKEWGEDECWDIFISAFNLSERVACLFSKAKASKKHWLIQPDYCFKEEELPQNGEIFKFKSRNESDFVIDYLQKAGIDFKNKKICIDITGFIKPYMMYLIKHLVEVEGVTNIDVLFSEPESYEKKEKTKFSSENVIEVRPIEGYAGSNNMYNSNDILIIGAGYDHELITHVALEKDHAKNIQIFGFPSLRPDMYQQNILRAVKATDAASIDIQDPLFNLFAPANDPFVTATVLSELKERLVRDDPSCNLYLSPLATKPQALGFTIFYLSECTREAVSILYPFCDSHSPKTSEGTSRIWKYTVEFPNYSISS